MKNELEKLEARLQSMRAQRDAAFRALEEHQEEAEQQIQLLTEEQDRFVSRLLDGHEEEIRELRDRLEEARAHSRRLERKLERARQRATHVERELLESRSVMERLAKDLLVSRADGERMAAKHRSALSVIEALKGELAAAHVKLSDALRASATVAPSQRHRHPASKHVTSPLKPQATRAARPSGAHFIGAQSQTAVNQRAASGHDTADDD